MLLQLHLDSFQSEKELGTAIWLHELRMFNHKDNF